MSHYLDRNNFVINGTLKIDQTTQLEDYVLVSGTAGEVSWRQKVDYISGTEYDHYIGEMFAGGIVTAVWKEGDTEKCLIAAPQDISYKRATQTVFFSTNTTTYSIEYDVPWSNVLLFAGASWSSSGASNSAIIQAQPGFDATIAATPWDYENYNIDDYTRTGYSGAVQHCANYTNPDLGTGVYDDWYLPSALELKTLFDNIGIINKTLYNYALDRGLSIEDDDTNFVPAQIGLIRNTDTIDMGVGFFEIEGYKNPGGYWTSTEKSATEAVTFTTSSYDSFNIYNGLGVRSLDKGYFLRARPFRIASETQKSIKFDADYIVISYKFTDGSNLNTRTGMIYPIVGVTPWNQSLAYSPGVNGGPFASNWVGYSSTRPWTGQSSTYDYTPGATTSIPAPSGYYNLPGSGNNIDGSFSILRHSGDNTGTGYESVMLNINAFKFHFPISSEIEIDCRCWWGTTGVKPVILGVKMYKGGQMIQNGFVWENNTAISSTELDSFGKVIPPDNITFPSNRLARVNYNLITKVAKIIKD